MNGRDFDRFVAEATEGLLRTAYLIVGDLHEAEDLVQETLFKVAKRWPKVSRMDYPVAYARRIVVNLALCGSPKRLRRRTELSEAQSGDSAVSAAPIDRHDELPRRCGVADRPGVRRLAGAPHGADPGPAALGCRPRSLRRRHRLPR